MKEAGEEVGLEGREALVPGERGLELWMERGRRLMGRSPEREAATIGGASRRSEQDLRRGELQAPTQEGPGPPSQGGSHLLRRFRGGESIAGGGDSERAGRADCTRRRLLKVSLLAPVLRGPADGDEDLARASPRT